MLVWIGLLVSNRHFMHIAVLIISANVQQVSCCASIAVPRNLASDARKRTEKGRCAGRT
jgi:hypothetical protein